MYDMLHAEFACWILVSVVQQWLTDCHHTDWFTDSPTYKLCCFLWQRGHGLPLTSSWLHVSLFLFWFDIEKNLFAVIFLKFWHRQWTAYSWHGMFILCLIRFAAWNEFNVPWILFCYPASPNLTKPSKWSHEAGHQLGKLTQVSLIYTWARSHKRGGVCSIWPWEGMVGKVTLEM